MNKSLLLLKAMHDLLENGNSGIVYTQLHGLKLIRYGGKDRFSPAIGVHYNSAPLPRGTWGSIYPYNMLVPFPEPHNQIHQGLTDQTVVQKNIYHSNTGTGLLKPVYFYWNHAIYSHIDRTGAYQNRGWTFYPNVKDLVSIINNNQSRLNMSVDQVRMNSTNVNSPGSTQTYFRAHEYEVFVPGENVRTSG